MAVRLFALVGSRWHDVLMAAQWDKLSRVLAASGDTVVLSWLDLAALVGDLPASASNHRAWWSGDRPHVRAWKSAGYEASRIRFGVDVTFVRQVADRDARSRKQERADDRVLTSNVSNAKEGFEAVDCDVDVPGRPDVLLVTCVKTKLAEPAEARDLYVSPLFKKQRDYAERLGAPWFILSAEHGLVAPDEWLAPYERYLPDTPASYQKVWGAWVVARLELLYGDVRARRVEIHASADYVAAVSPHLTARGALISLPLEGLGHGQRLSWYDRATANAPTKVVNTSRDSGLVEAFASALDTESRAMSPTVLRESQRHSLDAPGLYSWWVDAEGAEDLTKGLGIAIAPGLLYAGLAGATRWPSGRASGNTLWTRITSMHLGGNRSASTLRRTLAAILDAGSEAPLSEQALTRWMESHLRVIAIPYADPDTLGRLEEDVLRSLDPPLNLKGCPPSPMRVRLKALRGLAKPERSKQPRTRAD